MPPSVFPTGVTIYLPDRAHNCYVIFDTKDGFTRLIDMNGNQVKVWAGRGMPGEMWPRSPVVKAGPPPNVLSVVQDQTKSTGHNPSPMIGFPREPPA